MKIIKLNQRIDMKILKKPYTHNINMYKAAKYYNHDGSYHGLFA